MAAQCYYLIYLKISRSCRVIFTMNRAELQLAITILKGCIKARQDRITKIEDLGCDDFKESCRLQGEIDDLQLAINHMEDVL